MDYFWAEPERLETWGKGVISASCAWLLLGTVMTAAVFIVQTATRSTGASLETLFPGLRPGCFQRRWMGRYRHFCRLFLAIG
jgi:hypothetical protein